MRWSFLDLRKISISWHCPFKPNTNSSLRVNANKLQVDFKQPPNKPKQNIVLCCTVRIINTMKKNQIKEWHFHPCIQGGSDISGTLSKLHRHIKKFLFWKFLLPQTVSAVFRSINKNKKTHSRKDKSTGSYKSRDSQQPLRRTYHERDTELAQGEPYGGVGRGDLASQLAWLQAFWLFCMWRLWIRGQRKVSQQIQRSDPEDEGGDGVPRQGHPGEGLHELEVQDWGSLHSWW